MRNRGQSILGGILVGLGIILLLGIYFHINVWAIIWSAGLVAIGLVLLLRPRMAGAGSGVDFSIIGDIRRSGVWQAGNEEIWSGIGDIHLDFSQAGLPEGEKTVHIYSLIGDVEVIVPAGVGLNVMVSGLITELKHWGEKQDGFLRPLSYISPDYASAARRVKVEVVSLIGEMSIRQ